MMFIGMSLFIFIIGIGFFIFSFWRSLKQERNDLKNEIISLTARLGTQLDQTARITNAMNEGSAQAIRDVYMRLGNLEKSTEQMFRLGSDIEKLQRILKAPKARGGLGETLLAELIGQVIPRDHYELQFEYSTGVRVDAVIKVGEHYVPVDAKFPIESFERLVSSESDEDRKRARKEFERDVKKHIDAISSRYIVPEDGTLDFAFMYIPAENVFYEMIRGDAEQTNSLINDYALGRRVIPVSPNSFFAYLQLVLMGLRGLKVDESAREIVACLRGLEIEFERLVDDYGTLGTHLNHARGAFERVERQLDRFGGKLLQIEHVGKPYQSSQDAIEVKS